MVYLLMVVFLLSLGLTWCLRRYALTKNILDIPNHRSAHLVPTPRGGGMAFILTLIMAIPCLAALNFEILPMGMAIVGAGLLVAVLGFFDDHDHLSARFRLIGHFTASIVALYWLGGMPAISFLGWMIPACTMLNVFAVIYLVWLLNLYNFMDGIDGLASIEAISVCVGGAFLYWLNGDYVLMGLPLALAAAVLGFLWWNFPPARIFMGDAGSGFLGLILGLLSIQAASTTPQLFWCWLIMLGVFIVDATVTLLSHLFQGLKVYEAHRDHAYQHAVRRYGSHFRVGFGVFIINVFWLLPMAIIVNRLTIGGSTGLFIAYLPLVVLSLGFKAGRRDYVQ